ncbi:hypothetical protein MO973_13510 [Paenibacillus sp. TRM 82003]|nr:hypothetical protein [Paenibacillus sp. TRM 82003]
MWRKSSFRRLRLAAALCLAIGALSGCFAAAPDAMPDPKDYLVVKIDSVANPPGKLGKMYNLIVANEGDHAVTEVGVYFSYPVATDNGGEISSEYKVVAQLLSPTFSTAIPPNESRAYHIDGTIDERWMNADALKLGHPRLELKGLIQNGSSEGVPFHMRGSLAGIVSPAGLQPVVEETLRIALTEGELPNVDRHRARTLVVSTLNIYGVRLPRVEGFFLEAMDPDQIGRAAVEEGSFMYLEFERVEHVDEDTYIVHLNHRWPDDVARADTQASNGGFELVFHRKDGGWHAGPITKRWGES